MDEAEKQFCEGCTFNGDQPWSDNPLLVCTAHGGLYLSVQVLEGDEEDALLTQCLTYTPASSFGGRRYACQG